MAKWYKDNKERILACLILCIIALLSSLYGIADTHFWGDDFSQYIAQARALVEGNVKEWYEHNCFTIEHSMKGLGSSVYPWGTSILIAPIYAVWGINYIPYQVFMSICFVCSIAAIYIFLTRRGVEHKFIILICGLTIFNSHFLCLTKMVLSDIPCFFFTVCTWIYMDKYINLRNVTNAMLIGIFAFLAFSTRTMALSLLVAMAIVDLIYFIKGIKYKTITAKIIVVMCLPYLVFMSLQIILSCALPKGGLTYLDYFSVNAKAILSNIIYYCKEIVLFFSQDLSKGKVLIGILLIPSAILFCQGYIKRIKHLDCLAIYFIIMYAMLCVYSFRQGTRFILSFFPIILLCVYYGINIAKEHISDKTSILFKLCINSCYMICIICMILGGWSIVRGITASAKKEEAVNSEDALAVYSYLNTYLKKEDVVVFFKPRALCLYTDVYAYTNELDSLEDLRDVDYILNYTNDKSFEEFISSHLESLQLQYNNEQFYLYSVR